MSKENGRKEPADPKETAELKGKPFICMNCSYKAMFSNVEFGAKMDCINCNSKESMMELPACGGCPGCS